MKFPANELMKMCQGEPNFFDLKAVGGSEWVEHGLVEQRYIIFQYEDKFYSLCAKRTVNETQSIYWIDGAELSNLIDCPEFKLFGGIEFNNHAN